MLDKNENELEDEVLPEYDFSTMTGGVKGKYAERYKTGTNLVLLEPDVAKAFPTAESVNEALRQKHANCWAPSNYTSRKHTNRKQQLVG